MLPQVERKMVFVALYITLKIQIWKPEGEGGGREGGEKGRYAWKDR